TPGNTWRDLKRALEDEIITDKMRTYHKNFLPFRKQYEHEETTNFVSWLEDEVKLCYPEILGDQERQSQYIKDLLIQGSHARKELSRIFPPPATLQEAMNAIYHIEGTDKLEKQQSEIAKVNKSAGEPYDLTPVMERRESSTPRSYEARRSNPREYERWLREEMTKMSRERSPSAERYYRYRSPQRQRSRSVSPEYGRRRTSESPSTIRAIRATSRGRTEERNQGDKISQLERKIEEMTELLKQQETRRVTFQENPTYINPSRNYDQGATPLQSSFGQRQSDYTSSGQVRCQICHQTGHSAFGCRNRYSNPRGRPTNMMSQRTGSRNVQGNTNRGRPFNSPRGHVRQLLQERPISTNEDRDLSDETAPPETTWVDEEENWSMGHPARIFMMRNQGMKEAQEASSIVAGETVKTRENSGIVAGETVKTREASSIVAGETVKTRGAPINPIIVAGETVKTRGAPINPIIVAGETVKTREASFIVPGETVKTQDVQEEYIVTGDTVKTQGAQEVVKGEPLKTHKQIIGPNLQFPVHSPADTAHIECPAHNNVVRLDIVGQMVDNQPCTQEAPLLDKNGDMHTHTSPTLDNAGTVDETMTQSYSDSLSKKAGTANETMTQSYSDSHSKSVGTANETMTQSYSDSHSKSVGTANETMT
ncbi:MAG: SNUT3/LISCH7 family protein, partial [Gammaproteobacteria bacterium]|nr:SNUT3/LISCH7 family protein [Gammaproteobacteria bacterium]